MSPTWEVQVHQQNLGISDKPQIMRCTGDVHAGQAWMIAANFNQILVLAVHVYAPGLHAECLLNILRYVVGTAWR